MNSDLRIKLNNHPVKTGRKPTAEQWAMVKQIPKHLRFKCGDDINELDSSKVFKSYNQLCSNGIQYFLRTKFIAQAKYRVNGTPNPNRTKTPDEKKEIAKLKYKMNGEARWARHRAKMLTDPIYAERIRARDRNTSRRNKKAIIAPIMAKAKTPYMIAKNRLSRSIKRYLANLLAGTSHKHSEGAQFLVWLAQKQGVDITRKHEWHIDHLRPIKSFDLFADGVRANVNGPENVRWLTAKENLAKGSQMPTEEEIAAHALLVAEWRATL